MEESAEMLQKIEYIGGEMLTALLVFVSVSVHNVTAHNAQTVLRVIMNSVIAWLIVYCADCEGAQRQRGRRALLSVTHPWWKGYFRPK